jgi:hypothetical protein
VDLSRHLAVLWRFRVVTAIGVTLAILLAVLAAYKPGTNGLEKRGNPTYSSASRLLVTQTGFPEGRVVLPSPPLGQAQTPDSVGFADPARFMALADLYTKLILSDEVRRRIPEHPTPAQVDANPIASVSGSPILPIIELNTKAGSPRAARALNVHTVTALQGLLKRRQASNDIPVGERVQISILNAPSPGLLTSSPSHTASILALLLCLIGTIAVTHLLEAIRLKREGEGEDGAVEDPAAFDWSLDPADGEDSVGTSAIPFLELPGQPDPR